MDPENRHMDDLTTRITAAINRALRAQRYSAHQASLEVGGNPDPVRNIRRGHLPSIARLGELCEVLGLELYVGPPREAGAIDERRLREAVASTERTLRAHDIVLEPEAKADAIAAVYDLLDRERAPATAERYRSTSASTRTAAIRGFST